MKTKRRRLYCDQCQMLSINGVPCHEIGCPNMGARFDHEAQIWIKQRECFECGCTVDADDPCCSAPLEDEDSDSCDYCQAIHATTARRHCPIHLESAGCS